ncbi:hypothetical protein AgCh_022095 [Apium graveolens]
MNLAADTQKLADRAASLSIVDYDTDNLGLPILTVEEAVEKSSFFEVPPFLYPAQIGDFSMAWLKLTTRLTLRGVDFQIKLGSQYYFYMETQTALAIPDEDNCMVVYSSIQCPEYVHSMIARCLGIPEHNVRVTTRRVGGGFGGKAIKAMPVATACAFAAHKLRRPVRMYLNRKTDMIMAGGRHPIKITYDVGFKSDGKITALHLYILINAGMCADISPVLPSNMLGVLKKYDWGALSFDIKVRIVQADSLSLIQGGFTAGSTTSEARCKAVRICCNILIERLAPLKEKLQDQMISLTWDTLVLQAHMQAVNFSASSYFVPNFNSMQYLNYGAVVRGDKYICTSGGDKYYGWRNDIIYDCGQSLNPVVDLGQEIGFFMSEEYLTNLDGLVVADSTWTYKIPTIDTIPKQFNVEVLNSEHHKNRVLSSKASGEPPLVLAVSVHCATRAAIKEARKQLRSWNNSSDECNVSFQAADTQKLADRAASLSIVDYDTDNLGLPILTVEEAVEKSSFFEVPPFLYPAQIGDFSMAWLKLTTRLTLRGVDFQIKLGSQYYFYMETQTALAIPDEDNCMVVYSSIQCPEYVHSVIARCLGIPEHNVRVTTRRVGGGFGGKAIKAMPVAVACALAAHKLRRPVRMYLNRKTDMIMAGGRHPIQMTYDVGFKSDGKITALHLYILINAGMCADISPVLPSNMLGVLKKYDWGALSFDIKKRGISRVPIVHEVIVRPTPGKVSIYSDGSIVVEVGGIELEQGLRTKVKQMTTYALSSIQCVEIENFLDKVRIVQADSLSLIQGGFTAVSTTSEARCKAAHMQAVNFSASSYFVPNFNSMQYLNYGAVARGDKYICTSGGDKYYGWRNDIIYDCGQSLNPVVDLGQEIGFFMSEEYLTNLDGLVVADSTWTYKIPTIDTIPKQFNVEVLNSEHHKNRVLSSKASGEPHLLLAVSVHCATRAAIKEARKQLRSWNNSSDECNVSFQVDFHATMPCKATVD